MEGKTTDLAAVSSSCSFSADPFFTAARSEIADVTVLKCKQNYLSPSKDLAKCLPFGADERCDEEGQAEEAVHPVLEGRFVGTGGGP